MAKRCVQALRVVLYKEQPLALVFWQYTTPPWALLLKYKGMSVSTINPLELIDALVRQSKLHNKTIPIKTNKFKLAISVFFAMEVSVPMMCQLLFNSVQTIWTKNCGKCHDCV